MGPYRATQAGNASWGRSGKHVPRFRWPESRQPLDELRRVHSHAFGERWAAFRYIFPRPLIVLQQDFPFSIRIPESIPPSIALENRGPSLHLRTRCVAEGLCRIFLF